ncbi:MAG TPA: hypothetical protein VN620_09085 [Candidatus Methylomirabilis sp.]|nr:hypothetical protein [Candidatus Methylomirabilis sp.]
MSLATVRSGSAFLLTIKDADQIPGHAQCLEYHRPCGRIDAASLQKDAKPDFSLTDGGGVNE